MSQNVFFVNHDHYESAVGDGFVNQHEAIFVVGLCKFLIQQGYKTSQVTILATYQTQVTKIHELLHKELTLKKIRAASVDDFQSESNDIVIVSFVRSNQSLNIGFLKILYRVNAAVTRANKGLYCFGNFEYMTKVPFHKGSSMFPWSAFVDTLKRRNAIGDTLKICCQIHGTMCAIKTGYDFAQKAPEGGCIGMPRQGGHACARVCRIRNDVSVPTLLQTSCNKICNQICPKGHHCKGKCHYPTPCKCPIKIVAHRPQCDHPVTISCWENPSSAICDQQVQRVSPCGHIVTIVCPESNSKAKLLKACNAICNAELKCHQPGHRCPNRCHHPNPCWKCTKNVDKPLLKCGHILRIPCLADPALISCTKPCDKEHLIGVKCTKLCGEIHDDKTVFAKVPTPAPRYVDHVNRAEAKDYGKLVRASAPPPATCKANSKCRLGHPCPEGDHLPNACQKCVVKVVAVLPRCQHTVTIPCSLDPSTAYCTQPCERQRQCGHKCNDLCGAACGEKRCFEKMFVQAPCGHSVAVACSNAKDESKLLEACMHPCSAVLKCGHSCTGSCIRCKYGRLHVR